MAGTNDWKDLTNSGIYAGDKLYKRITGLQPKNSKRMSYVRIWLHCVWGTKNRIPFLNDSNKQLILSHIKENAKSKNIYIDFINGHKEHIHFIISLDAEQTLSKTIQLIKGEASFWINKNNYAQGNFEWADEYFAVSVSESQIDNVREYIKNQEIHHKKKTWEEEYNEFIEKYGFKELRAKACTSSNLKFPTINGGVSQCKM